MSNCNSHWSQQGPDCHMSSGSAFHVPSPHCSRERSSYLHTKLKVSLLKNALHVATPNCISKAQILELSVQHAEHFWKPGHLFGHAVSESWASYKTLPCICGSSWGRGWANKPHVTDDVCSTAERHLAMMVWSTAQDPMAVGVAEFKYSTISFQWVIWLFKNIFALFLDLHFSHLCTIMGLEHFFSFINL